jgi:hypothetical protein
LKGKSQLWQRGPIVLSDEPRYFRDSPTLSRAAGWLVEEQVKAVVWTRRRMPPILPPWKTTLPGPSLLGHSILIIENCIDLVKILTASSSCSTPFAKFKENQAPARVSRCLKTETGRVVDVGWRALQP